MAESDQKTRYIQLEQNTLFNVAKQQQACLILIKGFPQGQRYLLDKATMIVGREDQCNIVIWDNSISRKHAKIEKLANDGFSITDSHSVNGIHINNTKIPPGVAQTLQKEDIIQIGQTVLKYLPAGELETLYLGNLSNQAHTDNLTATYNKNYLMKILDIEFKRSTSLGTPLSIIFLDIDFFKKINDTYGHPAGDYILKTFADIIVKSNTRKKDILARYGGEEFVLVPLNTTLEAACTRAEEIRAVIEQYPFQYENKPINITVSAGVCAKHETTKNFEELLEKADKALYEAKKSGRNKVHKST